MRSRSRLLLSLVVVLPVIPVATDAHAAVDSFVDDNNSQFEAYIETAKSEGLIVGCNPPNNNRICPSDLVTVGEMVLMLARAVGLNPKSNDAFVTQNGQLGPVSIAAVTAAGFDVGCQTLSSCPDPTVRRGQMAALFSNAFRWGEASNPERFVDLTDSPSSHALVNLYDRGGLLACDSPVDERLCPHQHVRRDDAIFAVVSVLGFDPAAIERAEPGSPPIGFGDDFDSLSLWDGRAPSYRNRVRLTADGYNGTGLRVTIPKGSHYGADFKLHLDDAASVEPNRLFFRYFIKFDPDWATPTSGKLPGFSGVYGSSGKGGYRSSPSNPGWSARLMFSRTTDSDPRVQLGYYVYHLGQATQYGDSADWNEAGRLNPGEWYCLEGQVEMNTRGLADGSLRAWVDETPALDLSGLAFRRPDEPSINVESFWFNVYYGGKRVPERNLGLTIDNVTVDTQRIGCNAGSTMTQETTGDFNGDTYPDVSRWEECPEGTCLVLERRSADGTSSVRQVRDTAWFSLETHRIGATAGDVDGDGEDELVYRGRCDGSTHCWRVERAPGQRTNAEGWGDGARFSSVTGTPTLGDWNGDGRDDLAYQGVCGNDATDCWRVHLSTGETFRSPAGWGKPPDTTVSAMAADLNGDGNDDLVYQAGCDQGTCWQTQMSSGSAFAEPKSLGAVTAAENRGFQLFDFDGNGTTDLVSWPEGEEQSRIEVRFGSADGLAEPVVLAELEGQVDGVHMERVVDGSPVTATVRRDCDNHACVESLFAASPRQLVDGPRFRAVMQRRLGVPVID